MDRFAKPTAQLAVEAAAEYVRADVIRGLGRHSPVPVDLIKITASLGLEIREDLSCAGSIEGQYCAREVGGCVRIRPGLGRLRRRFTLAHEIGHSLFYIAGRHQVGSASSTESAAEESLCSRFASALLMPAATTRALVSPLKGEGSWGLLAQLERASRQADVSLPALVTRLRDLRPSGHRLLIALTRYQVNPLTGRDPQLRLWTWYAVDMPETIYLPPNRTAVGMNLKGALALFQRWEEAWSRGEKLVGKYCLTRGRESQRSSEAVLYDWPERVSVSVRNAGRWKRETLHLSMGHCLYAPPSATNRLVYLASTARLVDDSRMRVSGGSAESGYYEAKAGLRPRPEEVESD